MDQNRDWRPIVALVLGGLAIFLAFRGPRGGEENGQVGTVQPQVIIVQPAAPANGAGVVAPAPVVVAPAPQTNAAHSYGWGRGSGSPFFCIFPLLLLGGLAFLAFRVMGNYRRGWGGPGHWGGHGPGQQGPPHGSQGQYPPQQVSQNQQSYSNYPQGYQPQQPPQAAQPGQGQPTQWTGEAHGDMTRPEGTLEQ
jgi:hypothetical protein